LLFDAKSEEKETTPLSPRDVRQALSHADWVSGNLGWPEPNRVVTVLVSPKKTIDSDAATIAKDLAKCDLDAIRSVARTAIRMARDVRARARGQSDEQLAAMVAREFARTGLSEDQLLDRIARQRVRNG
jgi:hypothetical protein